MMKRIENFVKGMFSERSFGSLKRKIARFGVDISNDDFDKLSYRKLKRLYRKAKKMHRLATDIESMLTFEK